MSEYASPRRYKASRSLVDLLNVSDDHDGDHVPYEAIKHLPALPETPRIPRSTSKAGSAHKHDSRSRLTDNNTAPPPIHALSSLPPLPGTPRVRNTRKLNGDDGEGDGMEEETPWWAEPTPETKPQPRSERKARPDSRPDTQIVSSHSEAYLHIPLPPSTVKPSRQYISTSSTWTEEEDDDGDDDALAPPLNSVSKSKTYSSLSVGVGHGTPSHLRSQSHRSHHSTNAEHPSSSSARLPTQPSYPILSGRQLGLNNTKTPSRTPSSGFLGLPTEVLNAISPSESTSLRKRNKQAAPTGPDNHSASRSRETRIVDDAESPSNGSGSKIPSPELRSAGQQKSSSTSILPDSISAQPNSAHLASPAKNERSNLQTPASPTYGSMRLPKNMIDASLLQDATFGMLASRDSLGSVGEDSWEFNVESLRPQLLNRAKSSPAMIQPKQSAPSSIAVSDDIETLRTPGRPSRTETASPLKLLGSTQKRRAGMTPAQCLNESALLPSSPTKNDHLLSSVNALNNVEPPWKGNESTISFLDTTRVVSNSHIAPTLTRTSPSKDPINGLLAPPSASSGHGPRRIISTSSLSPMDALQEEQPDDVHGGDVSTLLPISPMKHRHLLSDEHLLLRQNMDASVMLSASGADDSFMPPDRNRDRDRDRVIYLPAPITPQTMRLTPARSATTSDLAAMGLSPKKRTETPSRMRLESQAQPPPSMSSRSKLTSPHEDQADQTMDIDQMMAMARNRNRHKNPKRPSETEVSFVDLLNGSMDDMDGTMLGDDTFVPLDLRPSANLTRSKSLSRIETERRLAKVRASIAAREVLLVSPEKLGGERHGGDSTERGRSRESPVRRDVDGPERGGRPSRRISLSVGAQPDRVARPVATKETDSEEPAAVSSKRASPVKTMAPPQPTSRAAIDKANDGRSAVRSMGVKQSRVSLSLGARPLASKTAIPCTSAQQTERATRPSMAPLPAPNAPTRAGTRTLPTASSGFGARPAGTKLSAPPGRSTVSTATSSLPQPARSRHGSTTASGLSGPARGVAPVGAAPSSRAPAQRSSKRPGTATLPSTRPVPTTSARTASASRSGTVPTARSSAARSSAAPIASARERPSATSTSSGSSRMAPATTSSRAFGSDASGTTNRLARAAACTSSTGTGTVPKTKVVSGGKTSMAPPSIPSRKRIDPVPSSRARSTPATAVSSTQLGTTSRSTAIAAAAPSRAGTTGTASLRSGPVPFRQPASSLSARLPTISAQQSSISEFGVGHGGSTASSLGARSRTMTQARSTTSGTSTTAGSLRTQPHGTSQLQGTTKLASGTGTLGRMKPGSAVAGLADIRARLDRMQAKHSSRLA